MKLKKTSDTSSTSCLALNLYIDDKGRLKLTLMTNCDNFDFLIINLHTVDIYISISSLWSTHFTVGPLLSNM